MAGQAWAAVVAHHLGLMSAASHATINHGPGYRRSRLGELGDDDTSAGAMLAHLDTCWADHPFLGRPNPSRSDQVGTIIEELIESVTMTHTADS